MKKLLGLALCLTVIHVNARAADYIIDGAGAGMHAAIQFKASHMGISTLWGRFNDFSGRFSYDADDLSASKIEVSIDPASVDTNHEARDEHLRSADYLDVAKYPKAGFVSTAFKESGEGRALVTGELSFHGVSREVSFDVRRTGEGESFFGDYRVGFEGELTVDAGDFGIAIMPDATLTFLLAIEGIRQ